MKKRILTVLCGIPCSGKSTYIKGLKTLIDSEHADIHVVSSDNILEEIANEHGTTYDEVFQKYYKTAMSSAHERLQYQLSVQRERDLFVVWDQTNLTEKKRRAILNKYGKEFDKVVAIYWEKPETEDDWNEILKRNKNRPGKVIPEHIIRNMNDTYTYPSLEEGFDEVINLIKNWSNWRE